MYHDTFSFSRLFSGGLLLFFLLSIAACDKNDNKKPPTAPVVATAALTNITSSGATAGGSIVTDGGAAVSTSGIVWSKANATPTIADSLVEAIATTGVFSVNISGIDFDNTYYFRAFATNSAGTGYGDVVTLTTSSDSVRFTYNGESVTYGIITSPTTGKKWLDRNLGAKQVATIHDGNNGYDDYLAYGDLFQWGRPADGHQLINWTSATDGTGVNGLTTVLATSDVPGHSNFIIIPDFLSMSMSTGDWRSDNNTYRWNTIPQGPCPAGWHVPIRNEWAAEVPEASGGTSTTGGIENRLTAYSLLKLTTAGYRQFFDDAAEGELAGVVKRAVNRGKYWCAEAYFESTSSNPYNAPYEILFGSSYVTVGNGSTMALGQCVRCIKD